MGNVGNRVRSAIERPARALIERFRDADPPGLADAMNKTGAMQGIAPMYHPMSKCVGSAVTVMAPTGDALMVRKAMEIAQPGDVIVIDGRGAISRSLWGGNRSLFAVQRGLAGVIVDGATRDIEETRSVHLPLFARALCPMASDSGPLGEVNYPIACGGVVVNPGDIIVADAEGIVVIPRADADDVYAAWRKVVTREEATRSLAAAGRQAKLAEIDQLLVESGCDILP